ncbi:unnamed protein product, partial [Effrenium voratum]
KVCAHLGLDYESLVFRLHAQMTAAAREDQAPKTPQAEAVEFVEKTKSLGFRVEMPDIEHDHQAQQAEAAESGEPAEKTECLGFRVEMPDIEHEHQAPKPPAEAESVEPLEKTESLGFREMEMPNVEPEHQETAEEALEAAWAAHTGSPGSEADVGQPVPTQDEPEDLDDSTLLEIEALKTQTSNPVEWPTWCAAGGRGHAENGKGTDATASQESGRVHAGCASQALRTCLQSLQGTRPRLR